MLKTRPWIPAAALAAVPHAAWAHHVMDGNMPWGEAGVALAALWAHRQLIAAHAAWVRPVSAVLGAAVSTIGALFLVSSIAG